MPQFHRGQLITYADPDGITRTAILQKDVDTDTEDRNADFSRWSVDEFGVIAIGPVYTDVTHASQAGGAPYWVAYNGEYEP